MNVVEVQAKINQKLSHFSLEQLNSVWEFIEALDTGNETNPHVPNQTILERMGGYPKHLLEGTGDLSDRDKRKQIIREIKSNPSRFPRGGS